MADVDFGHIITQDSTIVPDVYSVGTNWEVAVLNGAALHFTELVANGVYLVDGGTVTAKQMYFPLAGIFVFNVTAVTQKVFDAAVIALAKRLDPSLRQPGDSVGAVVSGTGAGGVDKSTAPSPTALVPGSWTPT